MLMLMLMLWREYAARCLFEERSLLLKAARVTGLSVWCCSHSKMALRSYEWPTPAGSRSVMGQRCVAEGRTIAIHHGVLHHLRRIQNVYLCLLLDGHQGSKHDLECDGAKKSLGEELAAALHLRLIRLCGENNNNLAAEGAGECVQ